MKSLQNWQNLLIDAKDKKYPDKYTSIERTISLYNQLDHLFKLVKAEKGLYKMTEDEKKHLGNKEHLGENVAKDNVVHRVACVIADALLLCGERKTTYIEEEMEKVLDFFKKPREK